MYHTRHAHGPCTHHAHTTHTCACHAHTMHAPCTCHAHTIVHAMSYECARSVCVAGHVANMHPESCSNHETSMHHSCSCHANVMHIVEPPVRRVSSGRRAATTTQVLLLPLVIPSVGAEPPPAKPMTARVALRVELAVVMREEGRGMPTHCTCRVHAMHMPRTCHAHAMHIPCHATCHAMPCPCPCSCPCSGHCMACAGHPGS